MWLKQSDCHVFGNNTLIRGDMFHTGVMLSVPTDPSMLLLTHLGSTSDNTAIGECLHFSSSQQDGL